MAALYHRNLAILKIRGTLLPGFLITRGVRQGCPLSPLIFAIVADVLLRQLVHVLPDSLVRAFADDTAVVTGDIFRDAAIIEVTFKAYSTFSGLSLNLGKCELVPLWRVTDWAALPALLGAAAMMFYNFHYDDHARYLGILLGPGAWSKL